MADWHAGDFTKIVPDKVSDFVSDLGTITNTLRTVLLTISDVLNKATSFLVDPGSIDWVEDITEVIDEIKDAVLGAGFYYLGYWDHCVNQLVGRTTSRGTRDTRIPFRSFISYLNQSFDDAGDDERPQISSGKAYALVVVAYGTEPDDLWDQIKAIKALLTFDKEIEKIQDIIDQLLNPSEAPTYSRPPDWENATSKDILVRMFPDFSDLISKYIDKAIKILGKGDEAQEGLKRIVRIVDKKILALANLTYDLGQSISNLDDILAATGISVLFISTSDGIDGVRYQLTTAGNQPEATNRYYIGGCMFLSQDPVFETLFGAI